MVKTVLGDETQLTSIENRLTGSAVVSEVGLVIGKLSSKLDRGFVYGLLPTPPNDAGEPPCSVIDGGTADNSKNKKKTGSSKPKPQADNAALFIDQEWVSEHARQVSRMLLGGMKVIGIYVWLSESLFKNSTIAMCQTVKGVAEAGLSTMNDNDERILIHISYSPLRWTCRNISLASSMSSSSLRPCDFKMGKVLSSIQTFRCTYNFDARFPITSEDGTDIKRLSDALRDEIAIHSKELAGARALINGKLVSEDELNPSDSFHEVEFLLPFQQDKYLEGHSQKKVLGVLSFRGSVCSLAYLNSREPLSQALDDIKEDIIRSLRSRLDIICDEADRELESLTNGDQESKSQPPSDKANPYFTLQEQSKQHCLPFPRRVFVPWLDGTYICDYILSPETIEVIKDHCMEVMSTEVPEDVSEILEPESEATITVVTTASKNAKSFWDIATNYSSESKSDHLISSKMSRNADNKSDYHITVQAIMVLIASIILGLIIYALRGQSS